ncbi:hypothetical protein Ait01nite_007190 [Actinoplanes italicus]|uniref:Uncharacterized protein n=1 Tax=Actinoplanes italicus TaxID=113567 RepID=A0A2T0KLU0_9ACTN|nr:hypothetical protein [Actinoplanes italicus]PRX24599.1 hypothetical protein CLV67_102376 [Actinoplanes italicus]GIE27674.1 hypothetical protein Ait01nite_007190 [Actinoplanes italicus]
MPKNRWIAVMTAVVLSGAVATLTVVSPFADEDTLVMVSRSEGRQSGEVHFELRGKPVRNLYPGSTRHMKITVENPLDQRLRLEQVTAEVSSSSRHDCPTMPANLQVGAYSGGLPVTVHPAGRTELPGAIPITMPMGASINCAGTDFTVTIYGVGLRTNR